MNETDYIKEALLQECVNGFVNSVLEYQRFDSISDQNNAIETWSQAVLAAVSIKTNVEVINRKQGEI
jgi:hypothetical protein